MRYDGTSGTPMQVFLLEDDEDSASFVIKGLKELGHEVVWIADGAQAVSAILGSSFDVLVLDRMVPSLDGLSVLRAVRAAGCDIPSLVLTARSRTVDKVEGFEAGADDYLVKPFAFQEFVARLNALARRSRSAPIQSVLKAGDIEMDLIARTVTRAGRDVLLQPREFTMLEYMMRNAGKIVTRTMLLDHVWELGFDPKTNIVETQVSRLRAKLDEGCLTSGIRTMRGAGYMIAAPRD